ncbi:hypothetical protein LX32DRAFT_638922 [Colletotrichum zoysiae]|uniref:Uncharacterized protein n=1 Tax=Colletotrichum zoysiae TaxID=1216348 RepID=A0AAD9HIW9_9PEZI|nr:hypothetical protein LX32DRAFT_638922 [Colletotrichum zoysiae]
MLLLDGRKQAKRQLGLTLPLMHLFKRITFSGLLNRTFQGTVTTSYHVFLVLKVVA